jgi:hypothetical protein
LDHQIVDIEAKLAIPAEMAPPPSDAEIERFLARSLGRLASILVASPEVAREQLARHIGQLTLHPLSIGKKGSYEVRGDISLFAAEGEGDEAVVMLKSSVNRPSQHYNNLTVPFSAVVTPARWKRNQVAA